VLLKDLLGVAVLVALLVDAFAFAFEALLVLVLFVIYVLLEAIVHLQSRIEPVFDRVVCSAWHVLCNQRPLFAKLKEETHQLFVFF
jgi:hypothetical protein